MNNPQLKHTDSQGRLIAIGGHGNSIVAKHNNHEVGRFDFDFTDDGHSLQMVLLAEQWYGDFYVVDHFSIEGAAFFNYCRSKEIFQYSHKVVRDERY